MTYSSLRHLPKFLDRFAWYLLDKAAVTHMAGAPYLLHFSFLSPFFEYGLFENSVSITWTFYPFLVEDVNNFQLSDQQTFPWLGWPLAHTETI